MGVIAYVVVQGVCCVAPFLGTLIGFGVAGPIGGGFAAGAQAYIGGAVAAGSCFSACQSAAMTAAAVVPI